MNDILCESDLDMKVPDGDLGSSHRQAAKRLRHVIRFDQRLDDAVGHFSNNRVQLLDIKGLPQTVDMDLEDIAR
jgi:hypothetical protein